MEVEGVSYVGQYRLTWTFIVMFLLGIILCGTPAVLVFFPDAYQEVFGGSGRGAFLFQGPRVAVIGLWGGITVLLILTLLLTATAAAIKTPLISMDGAGVTCFDLRGRGSFFSWAEITRVSDEGHTMFFFGDPSTGRDTLGAVSGFGQDLTAMWRVIAHYRPDLVEGPG